MSFRVHALGGGGAHRTWLPRGVAIACIASLCVIGIGYDLYRTWEARSSEIEETRRDVANLTWSAAQHAEEAFRLADTSLIGLVERAEVDGVGPPQLERMRNVMALRMAASPILQALNLMDERGDVIASGLPVTRRINIADRVHFQQHMTHADRAPFISELLQSRVSGQWVVAISRRVDHADGSFAGIVAANVSETYFQDFYDTFDLGHDGLVTLLRDDGKVLARHPAVEAPGAIALWGPALFHDLLRKVASGSFERRSPIDGITKIYAYRRVTGFPLVVVVALSIDEELAAWRASAIQHLISAIAVALLLGFFAIRLARQIRLLARAEQTTLAANTKLDRLARHLAKARDQAEEANRAKSRFLTGMTYELRTPLHGILGHAELLSLDGGLNPTQSERVAAMLAAGEHLLGMINAVLDLSQIEADRLELHPVEIELSDFARACLNLVRPAAAAKGLALILTAAAPLRSFADPTRLRQIVINLLGNAIKFTPSGVIEVRLGPTEDELSVRLEVADTGPGIRPEHRDKLFQTFERLNAKAVSAIEGTGLGLAIAARLAQLMGGRLGYADNPGGGSVFWLELPAKNVGAAFEVAAASPRAARPSRRVLVVDDDALNRSIATSFLRFGGHDVVCLDNGAAAVEAAAAADFDVILMDVRMPGMNGLEATHQIRALSGPRGIVPVVAMTAQAFGEQIELCRQAGMNTHLSKPFTQSALLAAIEDIALEQHVAALPAISAPAGAETQLPIFDRAAFEDITDSLPLEDIARHLQTLLALGDSMLHELCAPDMLAHADELAKAAHRLAGSVGTFGFLSLAAAGRRFERAADAGLPETAALGDALAAAIEASVTILRQELSAAAAPAI
jgi:signal transduction histidine kinase/FixJ family two-component response regulator